MESVKLWWDFPSETAGSSQEADRDVTNAENIAPSKSTKACPLFDLPPELFKLIIEHLSSESAWNLLQCNHALFTHDQIWKQRMHTPLKIAETIDYSYRNDERTADWACILGRQREMWYHIKQFIKKYPEKAKWVQRLSLDHTPAYSLECVLSNLEIFPAVKVVDARGTIWGQNLRYYMVFYLGMLRSPKPRCTMKWTAKRTPENFLVDWLRFREVLQQYDGRRYLFDEYKAKSHTGPVMYQEYRVRKIEGGVELVYEGDFRWENIQWDHGDTRLSIWKGVKEE
jgi:hypothetical protein